MKCNLLDREAQGSDQVFPGVAFTSDTRGYCTIEGTREISQDISSTREITRQIQKKL